MKADRKGKGEVNGTSLPDILVAKGDMICMRNLAFDYKFRNIKKHPGAFIMAKGGFLEDSWLNNLYWEMKSVSGQILVFDENIAYGVAGVKRLVWKSASHDVHKLGSGYNLYAMSLKGDATPSGKEKGKKKSSKKPIWSQKVPIKAQALILSNDKIFIAGGKDDSKLWFTPDSKKLGLLAVFSKKDGTKIAEYPIQAAPVMDGLAAAGGRVYLVLKNGDIVCYGE